jgi:6-phosphogluconolactonase
MPELRVFATAEEMDLAVAGAVAATITSAVRARGRCSLALSGGNTPRAMYGILATTFRTQVPWQLVHVFWGDERIVPAGDPRRNDQMAREMLLSKVPCPDSQIHPMAARSLQPPDEAAREYEETMRQYFADGRPRFDLVLLGLGADGHTASLFPHSPALDEGQRWVRAVVAPAMPPSRLTLTLPVLTQAAHVSFVVTGADKSGALRAALDARTDPSACPAAAMRLAGGEVTWWADTPAAGKTNRDQDGKKGAVEGTERDPIVPIQPNGANFDDSEVSNADEKGHTTDHPRDEQR